MRITRDTLLKLARDFTEKRLMPDRNVTAVFLVGSVRPEDAPLPPVVDVDLLVIYNGEPPRPREMVKLSNEIHLDVTYENAREYAQPRELRGDPWRGWIMWDPLLLHQKGRFFEYTQSIVRAQFEEPENLLKRCRTFAVRAREAWSAMTFDPQTASPLHILEAAADAANALATLSGPPLPERKLLAEFPARAEVLGMPELTSSLLRSITANLDTNLLRQSLPAWETCFLSAAQATLDVRIHPARLTYYKTAIETQLSGDLPAAAFWPLLYTWALSIKAGLSTTEAESAWQEFLRHTGLDTTSASERLEALDSFLDRVEETLERIAAESGL
ncbi:MAG: hypothetical protein N2117_12480 [Anaerolineales bacterium]|nr:hypothetical protein [Anaerolineales bacterium]MCX7756040.1 hypothetical protein [Anaerolineales bacterium]MDW8277048.1 hypothetical protein [Anaerolineales bacterium]